MAHWEESVAGNQPEWTIIQSSEDDPPGRAASDIDANNEAAGSNDSGSGRRTTPGQAVFVAEKPIAFEEGVEIEVHLVQNPGGWNSDDNQTHNLGRFRLAVPTAPDPVA